MTRPVTILVLLLALAGAAVVAGAAVIAAPARAATPATLPSAADIDAYLAGKGSPMTGQGAAFVASGGTWQIDPRLLVAIAGAESSFGAITCAPFNAWGYGCPNGPFQFASWADGIDTVARGLRTNYLSEGRTSVALINLKYAPVGAANDPTGLNNNWTINVSRFLIELGGDPSNIDLAGVGGTISLGTPLGTGSGSAYDFTEDTASEPADGGAETGSADSAALEVTVGAPKALVVRVRNTGTSPWSASDVRLRRIDLEPRVVGAPYGALSGNTASVAPGATGEFVVSLAAAGQHDGSVDTTWRLEGPEGMFGGELTRTVRFAVPAFVAGPSRVEVAATNGGIAPGPPAWRVVVHVRNDGRGTWVRDGDSGILLGLRGAVGEDLTHEGWVNERVPARMLERTAAPGEEASFAFRVRGDSGALAVLPFMSGGWAAGDAAVVEIGTLTPEQLDELRAGAAIDPT